jgi:hypothetical protein
MDNFRQIVRQIKRGRPIPSGSVIQLALLSLLAVLLAVLAIVGLRGPPAAPVCLKHRPPAFRRHLPGQPTPLLLH